MKIHLITKEQLDDDNNYLGLVDLSDFDGHIEAEESLGYVKFKIRAPLSTESKEEIKQKAEAEFSSWIDQNLEVADILEPSGIRTVKVYKNWSPCGGTHVKSLKDIGRMEISDVSINKKEGIVTIKYCFSCSAEVFCL